MPAMSNILLRKDEDGVSDLTLFPVRDVPFPHWRANVSGLPVSGNVRVEFQFETQKNGKTRVNIKLIKPLMAVIPAGTVNAAGVQAGPTVLDEESASVTFFLSPMGTDSTRAELMRYFAHLMSGASATAGNRIDVVNASANAFKTANNAAAIPYAIVNLLFPGA